MAACARAVRAARRVSARSRAPWRGWRGCAAPRAWRCSPRGAAAGGLRGGCARRRGARRRGRLRAARWRSTRRPPTWRPRGGRRASGGAAARRKRLTQRTSQQRLPPKGAASAARKLPPPRRRQTPARRTRPFTKVRTRDATRRDAHARRAPARRPLGGAPRAAPHGRGLGRRPGGHVVAEDLAVALGAALAEALATLTTARHVEELEGAPLRGAEQPALTRAAALLLMASSLLSWQTPLRQ